MRRFLQSVSAAARGGVPRRVLRFLFVALLPSAMAAQANPIEDTQNWSAIFATGKLEAVHTKARYWLEGQGRFGGDVSRFNQGILRPGLGWALSDRVTLWGGYAWIPTDPPGVGNGTSEHRLWQQVLWVTPLPLGSLTLTSRTRLEQRWFEHAADAGWRLRQFTKLTHPIALGGRIYASLWDEVFIALDDTDWGARAGLDQNRGFAGIGVRFSPAVALEAGYLNQYVFRHSRADASNHILALSLYLNL